MIKIVDYGIGNVQAFLNAYKALGIPAKPSKTVAELKDASHLILPGVGSFDQAMTLFKNSGMKDEVEKLVINNQIPILGVCVGMQILGNSSDEGDSKGLGWIDGHIKKIKFATNRIFPLPHMGWNKIYTKNNSELFFGLEKDASFYFLHSFYFDSNDKSCEIADFFYGENMTCAIKKNNIYGVQFHPEKKSLFWYQTIKKFF